MTSWLTDLIYLYPSILSYLSCPAFFCICLHSGGHTSTTPILSFPTTASWARGGRDLSCTETDQSWRWWYFAGNHIFAALLMIRGVINLFLLACVSCTFASRTAAHSKQDWDLASEMYLYAWPLVMTSLTRESMFYCPDNIMMPLPVFPNPNVTAIVKPNVDTLYDACWINHDKADELILTVPDTTYGLYFLFPLMDAWTNVVECPGWRTTGKTETTVLIRGPNSNVKAAEGEYDMIINSPTTIAYLLGRTNVEDQNDLLPTQQQLFAYDLDPIRHRNPSAFTRSVITGSGQSIEKSNPVEQIFSMSAEDFFNTFAELMITNPPILPQDEVIVASMRAKYGLTAGQPWEFSSLSVGQQQELSDGLTHGVELIKSYPVTRVNGWTIPDMATGNYGTDYYLRAYIGLVLYAASLPQDTVYFETEIMPGGGKVFTLEFTPESGGPPPTNEFWSVTMYSDEGYLVPNENSTYSISSQHDLVYRSNGSVHITISMTPPVDLTTTNWLPAPQAGEDFQLTLRVFWPQDPILDLTWTPPALQEVLS